MTPPFHLLTRFIFTSVPVGILFLLWGSSFAAESAPVGRTDNRVRFCGFGGDGETLDFLNRWWPNVEYCRAYDSNNLGSMVELGKEARKRKMMLTLQAAGPVVPEGYLEKNQAWAIDFLNRKPAELGFGHPVADYCHPATVAAMKENLDVAIQQVGATSLSMVDFVWPWVGGSWGYSEACFATYRSALAGTDGGLRTNTAEGVKVLSFWDYFAELSGLRFTPQELGYGNWKDYEPVRSNQMSNPPTPEQLRNVSVFRGLFHYCWLRYAQEAGAHVKSRGGELQASLNPENMANGTDLLMWGRLADTGEPWLEQWGSPWNLIAGHHTYRYFTEPYLGKKKRLGLIGETGAAGGHPGDVGFGPARPHYWDPNTNYAVTWALGASGQFNDREEDYIYTTADETTDPASPQADSWRGYVKGMDGFWQYALDAPKRPEAKILSIVNRSILHHSDTSEQSLHQKYTLAAPLLDLHLDFEQAYFPLSDANLKNRQVILFAPWDYPRDVLPRLQSWLKAEKNRVLVTHSFVPTRPCKGLSGDVVPEIDEPDAAAILGLSGLRQTDIKSGKINSIDPAWADGFAISAGIELHLDRPLVACAGKPLVKLGAAPLVTRIDLPAGGTTVYLNFTPPERYETDQGDSAKLTRAVLQAIIRQRGIESDAEGSATWACNRYDLARGNAYLLLDRKRLKQERFTEETASMDSADKLWLRLKPQTRYDIYDVLAETSASRSANDHGLLEIFLSGRAIRLLYVVPQLPEPSLLFTTAERRDGASRNKLPAKLHFHRPGKGVIAGVSDGAKIYIDGAMAPILETESTRFRTIVLSAGDHSIEVK